MIIISFETFPGLLEKRCFLFSYFLVEFARLGGCWPGESDGHFLRNDGIITEETEQETS